jgi:D-glycero-beta-D-manno-heptose 1-phosphate adenylyltransferase
MNTKLDLTKSKIFTDKNSIEFQRLLNYWRYKNKKTVFTNGCFDILHRGHIEYITKAATLGNIVIIGLNTDSSVKRLKGEKRPINEEYSRALMLASLRYVDAVVMFDEDTPFDLIEAIQPDVLVKGGDYKAEEIVGYDTVMRKGGKVLILDIVEGYSTTSLIEKQL